MDQGLDGVSTGTPWTRPADSAAETRRHFDVVADRLMDKIPLVGEGVLGVDQKLDRFRGEAAEEFRKVDRRLLRLEARVIGWRRRLPSADVIRYPP